MLQIFAHYFSKSIRILFVIYPLAITLVGCSGTHHGITVQEVEKGGNKRTINVSDLPEYKGPSVIANLDILQIDVAPSRVIKDVLIDINNTLDISFHTNQNAYAILPGDKLQVSFVSDQTLGFEATVRPDGKITLPRLGIEVKAAGGSALDLARNIGRKYASIITDPQAVISVQSANAAVLKELEGRYNVRLDGRIAIPSLGEFDVVGKSIDAVSDNISQLASELFQTPVTATIGMEALEVTPYYGFEQSSLPKKVSGSRNINVGMDGMIHLPNAGTFKAEGKTAPDLAVEIKRALESSYQNPVDVTVSLLSSPNQMVYVGGQVAAPGRLPYANGLTVFQALSAVGWVSNDGNMDSVRVLRPTPKGAPVIITININEVLDGTHLEQDIRLYPHDTIYVERTTIAEADLFVEQYLNKLIPFNKSISYTYGQIVPTRGLD